MSILNIIKLFVKVDDFLKINEKRAKLLENTPKAVTRKPELSDSEIMTIFSKNNYHWNTQDIDLLLDF